MLAMSPEKQQMLLKYPWAVLKAASTETQLDALMDLSSEVSKVRGGLRAVDLSIIAHTFKRMIQTFKSPSSHPEEKACTTHIGGYARS
mmetsp:Transcript_11447/g.36182  ORF Transcript_11447/g.36182 Transcript_11447/m.36182 type:complete len:88 (+) Transcript_11447:676-939(+)